MSRRKICVVTGSRAEYGLLFWLMKEIQNDPNLHLQLVLTGMHLSPEFGLTHKVVEEDGFHIDSRVEMLLSSDTPVGIAKSLGLGVIGFADALDRLNPDILVVVGDRLEILAAAQAAMVARVPIAHIAGGDTTEGSVDESIRHSITKMSHMHFVTNEVAARRVKQLGENPLYVFNVGSPGLDQIMRLTLMGREDLENDIDFRFRKKNLLITFNPATLDIEAPEEQFQEVLNALDSLVPEVGLIFTKPNSDTYGRRLITMINDYVSTHPNAKAYASLGTLRYLSTIAQVDAVVGNSSSGLYEVPSFKKPTVNIGDRQKGRLQASSIINCEPEARAVTEAIQEAFVMDCSNTINPYGDGNSSRRILNKLKEIADPKALLKKHFFEMDC